MCARDDDKSLTTDPVCTELLHLDTHPKYERRGIGSRLVRWGIDKSEESEIPLYLESTEIGAPLYERFGFTEVDRLTLDVEKWAEFGARGTYSYHFMIREPRSRARV
ncbi:hypothetical protein MMC14_004218 [Varicellaria rhodocarpa]|nr:hypothetical protein [Varicellaria rhodocarpa]